MSSVLGSSVPSSPSLMAAATSRASSPFDLTETGAPVNQIKELEAQTTRHSRYSFEDGNLAFRVEDTLYNVHRYFFVRDSEHFRAILQGNNATNPHVLSGVNCADFDAFLAILYPTDFRRPPSKTTAQWTSILHLAAKWGFQNIKLLAIDNLAEIVNPVDKIVLGRRYGIIDWLPTAYEAVCTRPDTLTVEEGMRLGVEDTVRISAARQLYGTGTARYEMEYLAGDLREIFRLEQPSGGGPTSTNGEEDAIKVLEAQVAEAQTELLAIPTPPVGNCLNLTRMDTNDGRSFYLKACGSCGSCKPESNKQRLQREMKEKKERQLRDLKSRRQELKRIQSSWGGSPAVAQPAGPKKLPLKVRMAQVAAALQEKKTIEVAITILEAQIAEARAESLASPTPPVGACMNPTRTYTNGEACSNLEACDSYSGCLPESNEQKVKREAKEEKERQIGDLKSRLEERRKELIKKQGRMSSFR